jgi:uncharacterized surface protein with fasciclin (FAS1) repeats
MKKYVALAALALAVFSAGRPAFAQDKTLVEIAASSADFSTLVSLVKAAGLAETLSGEGPFTVFAPTNAAFAKVPKSVLAKLGKNPEALKAVLTYHVVAGKVMAADVVKLKDGTKVKTVNGASITVGLKHGVMVDKAKVVKTDIVGSNGVIHVIDSVILPKGLKL